MCPAPPDGAFMDAVITRLAPAWAGQQQESESSDFQPVSRLPHQTWSRSEIHSFSGKWWLKDSTCRSLGRSLPQPPALWGTRWAGRGGCNEGSSYFWDPRWRRWSLLPPETKTRTHTHEWADRAGVEEIRSRTYCELNLAAPHDVIQEGVHFDDLQLEMQRREIGSGKKVRAAADRHTSDSFELVELVLFSSGFGARGTHTA